MQRTDYMHQPTSFLLGLEHPQMWVSQRGGREVFWNQSHPDTEGQLGILKFWRSQRL